MHKNAMELMRWLMPEHPGSGTSKLYDVGSFNVDGGGTFRGLAQSKGWEYTGLDIREGKNVDIVVSETDPWDLEPVRLVISGNTFEHVKRPWETILQINDVLLPGGLVIIIAPWQWRIHRHPVDCWRILPDGMTALFESAGMRVLKVGTKEDDCFGVGRKPE